MRASWLTGRCHAVASLQRLQSFCPRNATHLTCYALCIMPVICLYAHYAASCAACDIQKSPTEPLIFSITQHLKLHTELVIFSAEGLRFGLSFCCRKSPVRRESGTVDFQLFFLKILGTAGDRNSWKSSVTKLPVSNEDITFCMLCSSHSQWALLVLPSTKYQHLILLPPLFANSRLLQIGIWSICQPMAADHSMWY